MIELLHRDPGGTYNGRKRILVLFNRHIMHLVDVYRKLTFSEGILGSENAIIPGAPRRQGWRGRGMGGEGVTSKTSPFEAPSQDAKMPPTDYGVRGNVMSSPSGSVADPRRKTDSALSKRYRSNAMLLVEMSVVK